MLSPKKTALSAALSLMTSRDRQTEPPLWRIEAIGIEPVPDHDRYGGAPQLFWVWFAGNLSFAYLVIGAVIWTFGLSLWQSVFALIVGLSAYWIIGYLGLPGQRTGIPTMAYSARYFGVHGNRFMAIVSWINMLGWETVVLVIATYAMETILKLLLGVPITVLWVLLSLILSAALELTIAFFGHALIERFQQWFSYIFGVLTLLVLMAFIPHIKWHLILTKAPGPWLASFLPAVTIVVAASVLSWVTTASDYTRHLPKTVPPQKVVQAAAWGSIISTGLMMFAGLLLSQSAPDLSSAVNPIALLLKWMPAWAEIPYLVVTMIGIIAGGILDAYSSGLSLLAAGVKVPRSRTIGVDAVVSIGASLYVLLVSQQFLFSFEAFLSLIAGFLAPWAAIALMNVSRAPRASAKAAMTSWILGTGIALSTTATPIFTGPLALGIFRTSSLGYFLGFAVTLVVYWTWTTLHPRIGPKV
ncbi:purine-cytosine permease family protein [Sulfobacillus thermosulfidooxidans]|uniref:purine-cytosine permease family protein n=1 Tax=Sulfobacillus thermosulfidooxidans TaxID=28034 RepID=UPI0012DF54C9|nr:cytosine permease [Sulfobacillus thermosulfidooxidans]